MTPSYGPELRHYSPDHLADDLARVEPLRPLVEEEVIRRVVVALREQQLGGVAAVSCYTGRKAGREHSRGVRLDDTVNNGSAERVSRPECQLSSEQNPGRALFAQVEPHGQPSVTYTLYTVMSPMSYRAS